VPAARSSLKTKSAFITASHDASDGPFRAGKRGAIPDHLAPNMERLAINRSNWVETVRGFGRLFKQAAGRSSSLIDGAACRSRRWFQGMASARMAFG
jgi:hypothetical protein